MKKNEVAFDQRRDGARSLKRRKILARQRSRLKKRTRNSHCVVEQEEERLKMMAVRVKHHLYSGCCNVISTLLTTFNSRQNTKK